MSLARWLPLCALALAPALAQEKVQLTTSDGFQLEAHLVASSQADAPVAVLLHQYRADKTSWGPLLPALQSAGFTAIALDQRAHGASTRKGAEQVKVADVPREKFGALLRQGPEDVKAALACLQQRGLKTDRVVLIGASYGCSVAILSAAALPQVKGLVLLSPGEDYFGVDVRAGLRDWTGPALVLASKGDGSYPSSLALARPARERAHAGVRYVGEYEGEAHGTALFGPPGARAADLPRLAELTGPRESAKLIGRLKRLADPRDLIVTWLADAAKLGEAPADGR